MRRLGLVLWSILLLSGVALAQKFPEYPVLSASQYSSCQTKNGIRVAMLLQRDLVTYRSEGI